MGLYSVAVNVTEFSGLHYFAYWQLHSCEFSVFPLARNVLVKLLSVRQPLQHPQ